MPVVLFTAEGKAQSGYSYNDITGVSYEYPKRYAKLVQPGEPFVYHMPGCYTGSGIVGEITPSPKPDHLVCAILNYVPFDKPVPLKNSDGINLEGPVYFSQGVRPISEPVFQAILGTATTATWSAVPLGGYAKPEDARAIEKISVAASIKWLSEKYDGESVLEMPHSNPGFDILVGDPQKPMWHAEVKGTRSQKPVFWMSEGERFFSVTNSTTYLLMVVTGVDILGNTSSSLRVRAGAVEQPGSKLDVEQWRGELLLSDHEQTLI